MILSEVKKWINSLPEEMGDHEISFRKFYPLDEENYKVQDEKLVSAGVDIEDNIIYFCNQESADLLEDDE